MLQFVEAAPHQWRFRVYHGGHAVPLADLLPLLAHLFTLKFAVPLLMLLDLGAFLVLGAGAGSMVLLTLISPYPAWLTQQSADY